MVDKRLRTTGLGEGATYTDEKHDRISVASAAAAAADFDDIIERST